MNPAGAPPALVGRGAFRRRAAEDGFLKRPQAGQRAEARVHAHDRDRDVRGSGRSARAPARARTGARELLEQDVGVDAAEAEAADARRGAARRGAPTAGARARTRNGLPSRPDCGSGASSKFAVGGSVLRLEGEQDLDQPGRAGRGEQVADVRLHRADARIGPAVQPRSPHKRLEARELDGVADGRAGGVALDQVDVARRPARPAA